MLWRIPHWISAPSSAPPHCNHTLLPELRVSQSRITQCTPLQQYLPFLCQLYKLHCEWSFNKSRPASLAIVLHTPALFEMKNALLGVNIGRQLEWNQAGVCLSKIQERNVHWPCCAACANSLCSLYKKGWTARRARSVEAKYPLKPQYGNVPCRWKSWARLRSSAPSEKVFPDIEIKLCSDTVGVEMQGIRKWTIGVDEAQRYLATAMQNALHSLLESSQHYSLNE